MADFIKKHEPEDDIPTPREIIENRREATHPDVCRLRDKCLKALHRNYNGKDDVYISIAGFDGFVVDIVAEQFNKRGWTCWRGSDCDGVSLIFKAKLG